MPRGPRDDATGVVHHVMARGIERGSIFRDDLDREDLLGRLDRLCPELGFCCLAWALMTNHFHLVLRSGPIRVSRLMARLGTGYALRFNQRHDRVGHLFQNRFRSRRATTDGDVVGLVLYVCRNPLEGGLVAQPDALARFEWCSVGALTGARTSRRFESIGETLALFDDDPTRARAKLRESLGATERSFAATAVAGPLPVAAATRSVVDLRELVRQVCAAFDVREEELRSRLRSARIATARRALAVRAAGELGLSGAEIAGALGVTASGVSRMLARPGNESTSQ
jgi:REP element-mobilizing transposase RayT